MTIQVRNKQALVYHSPSGGLGAVHCVQEGYRSGASNAVRESATASPQMPRLSGCSGRPPFAPRETGPDADLPWTESLALYLHMLASI